MERLLRGKNMARSLAMWAVSQLCELTLRQIGALFGGTDYAAVAPHIRRFERDDAIARSAGRSYSNIKIF